MQRIDRGDRAIVARDPPARRPVWSVAAGEGAVWAISLRGSTVYRIDPRHEQVAAAIPLEAGVPYRGPEAGRCGPRTTTDGRMLRIDPQANRQVARMPVGDGPAGFAFDGSFVWVLNHRENTLDRIDPATNGVVRMATSLGGTNAAAERIAVFGGVLWVTGRGLDLLRVSRANGAVLGQTEIGTGGIDVVTDGASLWAVPYEPAGDRLGQPIAEAVLRVDATGAIQNRLTPTRRLFADGVAAADGQLWLFDAVAGLLVRLPA